MLSEIEELRAAFTEEILKRRGVEEELERTKTVLFSLIYHSMAGQVFIPDVNLAKKYEYNVYRDEDKMGIVIEVDLDE